MNEPLAITATVALWGHKDAYNMRDLTSALERRDYVRACSTLIFYGKPETEKFADYIRMGEADITVRMIPKDEQTRLAVQALQTQLAEERVKWHQRQEAILAEISKLQALTFDGAVSE